MKSILSSISEIIKIIKGNKAFNPARTMVLGFLALIIVGGLLLCLPISLKNNVSVSIIDAFFTSTSAVCVTGLVVQDTSSTWSLFGQVVILILMQIGGLGFVSVITMIFFITKKQINLSQRLLIVQSLNLNDMKGVVKLVRNVMFGTLFIEGAGACILWIRFTPRFGIIKALGMGVFHSISAFCNAGFDLMGEIGKFSSLSSYSEDKVITITIMLLVIFGGMGFFVWEDIRKNKKFKKFHLHTKLVITITLFLIPLGWVLFYLTERENPATIGGMNFSDAIFASLFQSVMPRSGGFSIVSQTSLTGISRLIIMVFMFIGGSVGSAAGGIKNTTVAILFLSAINWIRGKHRLSAFGRTIPASQVMSAASVMVSVMFACFAGSVVISLIQPELPFSGVVFEIVSAMTTCGLSNDLTPYFNDVSLSILMVFMFFGRVGIMTLGMAATLNRHNVEKIKYPDTWIMMG